MNTSNQRALTRLWGNRTVSILLVLIVIGLAGAAVNTFTILRDAGHDQRYQELSAEMRLYAQQIANASRQAAVGQPAAFDDLARAIASFDGVRQQFTEGGAELPSPAASLRADVAT